MINQIIVEVLKEKEFVSLMDFGGFVSNKESAMIDFGAQKIYPPNAKIIFFDKLINTDKTLISRLIDKTGLSFDAAEGMIKSYIEEVKFNLDSEGSFAIPGLGVLVKQIDKSLILRDDKNTNLLSESFGLPDISCVQVAYRLRQNNQTNQTLTIELNALKINQKPVKSRKSGKALPYAASILGLSLTFAAYYFISKSSDYKNFGSIGPNFNQYKASEVKTSFPEKPKAPSIEKKLSISPKIEPQAEVKSYREEKFYVIAGSFSKNENAIELRNELLAKGYPAEILETEDKKFTRVSIQNFKIKEEAKAFAVEKAAMFHEPIWVFTCEK